MKEKGPVRKTLEIVAKIWTIISIPIEVYLLAHGLITGNSIEALLGGGGLAFDAITLKWLKRKDRQNNLQSPTALEFPRGSARLAYY